MLGLVTLFFLIVFTLLYVSKGLGKKSEGMQKAVDKITDNLDQLAFWGAIYSLAAIVLTPLVSNAGMLFVLVAIVANVLVFVMALPFAFDKLTRGKEEKFNAAILETCSDIITNVTKYEKTIGFVGAGVAFVLLAVMFS